MERLAYKLRARGRPTERSRIYPPPKPIVSRLEAGGRSAAWNEVFHDLAEDVGYDLEEESADCECLGTEVEYLS